MKNIQSHCISPRKSRPLLKTAFLFFICSNITVLIQAEPSTEVKKIAEKAFKTKKPQDIVEIFEKEVPALRRRDHQSEAYTLLAQYEEHAGLNHSAAQHYQQAAALSDTDKSRLLLSTVRSFLRAGETNAARTLLSQIPDCISGDIHNQLYRTGAVYEVWLLLAETRLYEAVTLLKKYSASGLFTNHQKALLFSLWWVDNDETAKETLLSAYPHSIETAAVRGEVTILPNTFWYLLPRNKTENTAQHTAESKKTIRKTTKTPQKTTVKPLYYQLGFFKTKKYADALIKKLQKDGFSAHSKTEKRASGTVYYTVFVEDDAAGTMGVRLKDAEYESYPVFP